MHWASSVLRRKRRGQVLHPKVSFRELAGPSCSRLGPGGVMWVLADVVGDVHLATIVRPRFCRPGLFWAADKLQIGSSGRARKAPLIL